MNYCPQCGKKYVDETLNFCLDDGTRLLHTSRSNEEATVVMSPVASARTISDTAPQDIRFCTTADGLGIAYTVVVSGPLLVRVLGHFTLLEKEWEWPDLRYFWECLIKRYTVVRYDGRGVGLSARFHGEFTEETRKLDLDAVLTAIGADSVTLFGVSEGGWTAADYANRHPERVSRIVLYGAYSRGAKDRPGFDTEEQQALLTLIRKGWGRDSPAMRQLFTSNFFRSDADPKLIAHFNELQRLSADADTAARYYRSLFTRGDGSELFRQVRVPTLVVHSQEDMVISADEGRRLASIIPGAQMVLLPTGTHYFPTERDVANRVVDAINRFMDK